MGSRKMRVEIINEAKKFLTEYLEGKTCDYESMHPWRKDSQFIIIHSLRVHSYATQIIENEFYEITQEDRLIIEMAAILHDIGKLEVNKGHAKCSTEIVDRWLKSNVHIASKVENVEKLLRVIETHSDKDTKDDDMCSCILKDADTLDEIGALSIFMASNQVDRHSPFFFNELLERLENFEINFCNRKMLKLKTTYGKKLLQDKKAFIEMFNSQLALELKGTSEIYDLNI
jgi:uncharacterized protein